MALEPLPNVLNFVSDDALANLGHAWPLAFYGTLHLLPQRDFRLIESEMKRNISKRRKAKGAERPEETDDRPEENPIEAVGQAQTAEEDPQS